MYKNPAGNITINDIELDTYVTHFHILTPLMYPLDHNKIKLDNLAAEGRVRWVSVR